MRDVGGVFVVEYKAKDVFAWGEGDEVFVVAHAIFALNVYELLCGGFLAYDGGVVFAVKCYLWG